MFNVRYMILLGAAEYSNGASPGVRPTERDILVELSVQRTTLRPEQADAYRIVHSRIPELVANALRDAGVRRWSIWRDGDRLVHFVESADGFSEVLRRMAARGSIDPEWDALIATLVDDAPGSTGELEPIWSLDDRGQTSGTAVSVVATS